MGGMDATRDAEVAVAAAEAGAAVVREKFGGSLERYAKVGTDFATQADLESERAIMAVIQGARPDDAVIGEEYGASGQAERTWLVDPLCGTLNFAAQNPLFSVNVALRSPAGDVAAVAQPLTGEIFWTDGTAVFVRHDGVDTPAVPSAAPRLVDIDIDAPQSGNFLGAQLLADEKLRAAFPLRVFSTTLTLAWVAAGRQAGYITDGSLGKSVHFAAGIILCQAAGAPITDFRGNPLDTTPGLVAAATPETHQQLLTLLAPHLG
jgi:myo-inositol-1(or 4)-monophosphatase